MASPITFSGFNSIDFSQILTMMMAAERAPMTVLETQKTALNTQGTNYTALAGKLGSLQSALETLTGSAGFSPIAATSGDDTAVGVTTTTGGVAGTYEVVVSQLARAQVMASETTYGSPEDIVGTSGSLSVLLFGNPPVVIPPVGVTGSMSVRQLADQINAQEDSPVNAAVVQAAPGQYRLVLTGRDSGSANSFTVTSTLAGGAGVTFKDFDLDGTYGENDEDLSIKATNAALTVNNIAITSATNSVEEAIPGVTLTLTKKDALTTVLVEVTQSSEAAKTQLDGFVKSYNDLMSFITEQNTAAASGQTSIARDGMVRGLKNGLREAMQAEYLDAGVDYSRLSAIGIEFLQTGAIKLDAGKLTAALKGSTTSVTTLFNGVFGSLKTQVQSYAQAGGLIQGAKDRLKDQIVKIDSRLDSMQLQLNLRRSALQQEFIAADLLMTQLKGQGSSLEALAGQYRLF
ncbi:MAG TPA: flagellar filament capping protein FliD [Vicinamibacterales bacterium]|nr:flagellar filament capping protein FliD [Vicinamibacterales bacterium]